MLRFPYAHLLDLVPTMASEHRRRVVDEVAIVVADPQVPDERPHVVIRRPWL